MPALPPGGLLLRVLYLSLDPYMRGRMDDAKSYAKPVEIGERDDGRERLRGDCLRSPGLCARATSCWRHTGWRTHAAWDGPALRKLDPTQAPITTGLGVLGMPGFTAYAASTFIGKPKAGRDRGRCGRERPGRLAGRATRQDRRRPRGRHCRRRGEMPLCRRGSRLRRRHRPSRARFRRASSPPPARRASTFISRMSAARSGRRCCRCSTPSRAFRSAD